MACPLCALLRQAAMNLALTADLVGNVLTGGKPGQTISQRAALARIEGSRGAAALCAVLTWFARRVLGDDTRDHCAWSITGQDSVGAELWHWGAGPAPASEARQP